MDAMGLALKKPHSVSTSGSFNHDPSESTKFPGIVSTVVVPPGLEGGESNLPRPHPAPQRLARRPTPSAPAPHLPAALPHREAPSL